MANDLVALVAENITDLVRQTEGLDEKDLLDRISGWLDVASQSDRFAATPGDRFREWVDSTLLPSLRRLGENGQNAWDTIRDPTSAVSKERIASVVLVLAVLTGLQHLDVATLVAIVILAIRCKSGGA